MLQPQETARAPPLEPLLAAARRTISGASQRRRHCISGGERPSLIAAARITTKPHQVVAWGAVEDGITGGGQAHLASRRSSALRFRPATAGSAAAGAAESPLASSLCPLLFALVCSPPPATVLAAWLGNSIREQADRGKAATGQSPQTGGTPLWQFNSISSADLVIYPLPIVVRQGRRTRLSPPVEQEEPAVRGPAPRRRCRHQFVCLSFVSL